MNSLVVMTKPKDPAAEAYRTLRTNIQYSTLDTNVKTIVVTSAGPGEGKSTTVCNLAGVMAQSGKKVLIVDADMRKPTIHKKIGISNKLGLSTLLIEDYQIENAAATVAPNLDVLPAGIIPPNPSEVLASNKMTNFIKKMEEKYDFIIIDAPPIIAVTDAQILSTKVEGVLFVVSQGIANIDATIRAKELLKAVNANILGVVFNNVEHKKGNGYGYYYSYYSQEEHNPRERQKKRRYKKYSRW